MTEETEITPVQVTATNAYLQKINEKDKGIGEKLTTMEFEDGNGSFKVTANVPKGKSISYWVINGVKYVFNKAPKSIVVKDLTWDCNFEVVFKKGESTTIPSPSEVQQARDGEQLLLETINADFYHMKNAKNGGGKAMRSFDFTEDYTNAATNKAELGGRITAKVKAKIPGSKKVDFWRFNDAEFHFSVGITSFVVHELNASMKYEPVFARAEKYYTVSCSGCTFSGGGYTNATQGRVKYGTNITVTTTHLYVDHWVRNGARWQEKVQIGYDPYVGKIYTTADVQKKSFNWTVKSNCTFSSTTQIH